MLPLTLRADVDRRTLLAAIPDGLRVHCSLYLNRCRRLTSLGRQLEIAGNFRVFDCSFLRRGADRLTVAYTIRLEPCAALESLGRQVKAGG